MHHIRNALFTVSLAALAFSACTQGQRGAEPVRQAPTLEDVRADNPTTTTLFGAGEAHVLVRVGYDSNRDTKIEGEPLLSGWGLRITRVDDGGQALEPSETMVTPTPNGQPWNGLLLNLPGGRYRIETLSPKPLAGNATWQASGQAEATVTLENTGAVQVLEFGKVCVEGGTLVNAAALAAQCKPSFDLAPRIASFAASPNEIESGSKVTFSWEVLDRAELTVDEGIGALEGLKGSKEVNVFDTARYTLTAKNAFGETNNSVAVNVQKKSIHGIFQSGGRYPREPGYTVPKGILLKSGKVLLVFYATDGDSPKPKNQTPIKLLLYDPNTLEFSKVNPPLQLQYYNSERIIPIEGEKILFFYNEGYEFAVNQGVIIPYVFDLSSGKLEKSKIISSFVPRYQGVYYIGMLDKEHIIRINECEDANYWNKIEIYHIKNGIIFSRCTKNEEINNFNPAYANRILQSSKNHLVVFGYQKVYKYDFLLDKSELILSIPDLYDRIVIYFSQNKVLFTNARVFNMRTEPFCWWSSQPSMVLDVVTGQQIRVGNMVKSRIAAKYFVLPNGKILFLGGTTCKNTMEDWLSFPTEVFDPDTSQFSIVNSFLEPRTGYEAVQLQDGRVMVIGGIGKDDIWLSSIEIYNP